MQKFTIRCHMDFVIFLVCANVVLKNGVRVCSSQGLENYGLQAKSPAYHLFCIMACNGKAVCLICSDSISWCWLNEIYIDGIRLGTYHNIPIQKHLLQLEKFKRLSHHNRICKQSLFISGSFGNQAREVTDCEPIILSDYNNQQVCHRKWNHLIPLIFQQ